MAGYAGPPALPPGCTWVHDPRDEALRDYFSLTDVALRRVVEPERGLYMAESEKVVRRALAAGHRPRSLLLTPRWVDEWPDLVEEAVRLERERRRAAVKAAAEEAAMERLLDALTGKGSSTATRDSFRQRFADGSLSDAEVEIDG